jgi:hypothetical protein
VRNHVDDLVKDRIVEDQIRGDRIVRTTARYRKPAHVGTYVMSATHSWSGAVAVNLRSS